MASSLDPYTHLAENTHITPQEKINALHGIVNGAQVGMLTTRSADGHVHSRAMTPAAPSATQLNLVFLANNVSHKFDEIKNDANVNVNFYDKNTTAWASFSGKAKISQDKDLIDKCWSVGVSAYFGDLKDGIHKGDKNDPRVAVIEVVPDEIRYWLPTKGAIGRTIEAGMGAVTGKVSAPGELRTITKEDIQLTQGLHSK